MYRNQKSSPEGAGPENDLRPDQCSELKANTRFNSVTLPQAGVEPNQEYDELTNTTNPAVCFVDSSVGSYAGGRDRSE